MKFIRAELHNHSTESDGALSVESLAAYAAEKNFGVLALTDHNTTSGHAKAYDAIRRAGYALALLPGVEITTFFGHILALGLVQMPDITTLDPRAPEPFFAMLRTAGARAVGIAHPFSVGSPLFIGCRFDMEMHDWNAVDYIEVFNTSVSESDMGAHPMAEAFIGNSRALALWERLVLKGQRIAAVTGKDLHSMPRDAEVFTTYAIVDEACTLNAADAVLGAVLRRQTIVTKGPLFTAHSEKGRVTVIFDNTSGYLDWAPAQAAAPVLELRDSTGAVQRAETDLRTPLSLSLAPGARSAVLKLYAGVCAPVHLLAVGAPLYLDKEGNG